MKGVLLCTLDSQSQQQNFSCSILAYNDFCPKVKCFMEHYNSRTLIGQLGQSHRPYYMQCPIATIATILKHEIY